MITRTFVFHTMTNRLIPLSFRIEEVGFYVCVNPVYRQGNLCHRHNECQRIFQSE